MKNKNKDIQKIENLICPEESNENYFEDKTHSLPTPIIPIMGFVAICGTNFTFNVASQSSIDALNLAMKNNSGVILIPQFNIWKPAQKKEDWATNGTYCKILNQVYDEEFFTVRAIGLYYVKTNHIFETNDCLECYFTPLPTYVEDANEMNAAVRLIHNNLNELSLVDKMTSKEKYSKLKNENNLVNLINMTLDNISINVVKQYEIICIEDPIERAKAVAEEIKIKTLYAELDDGVSKQAMRNISKKQKEYYLREQMKAISEELGDEVNEASKLTKKVLALKIPNKSSERLVINDVNKLSRLSNTSPDSALILNYIDVVCSLPWHKKSKDLKNLNDAKMILDKDHYGLELVKQRILEYLAVLNISKTQKMPILCLVGAPGVGKTSIAKSVARCLNRNFVKTSLGGVKDESEIRGHRRTYIGAMAGRIIKNMRISKVVNPVFLLDEIDKMSNDYRGDPSSAMLEVLDSEQNFVFVDNFLEIPYDLSNVLFIATANSTETIPKPLLDRMEVIEVNGYTIFEKLEIAKNFLIPKKQSEFNIGADTFAIDDDCLLYLIENYTMESGVRELERQVSSLFSKAILHNSTKPEAQHIVVISKEVLLNLMGKEKIIIDRFEKVDKVGFVNGLAWTSVGGAMLPIEVALISGNGNVIQTGNLGEVLKESGVTAMGYIKANCEKYGLSLDELKNLDLHIHLPMGATPKDGPSAGIAIATAIYSALKKKAINYNLAMTGEITLLGTVLAIGGVREKVLAAHRENIGKVILPKANMRDLDEIPQNIKEKIEFVFVSTFDDVIHEAIG